MHLVSNDSDRVVVIGGGLAGLASACTLAARNYRVTLLEKNSWLGGKAAVLDESGFRFDMGPTILIMPSVLRRIFAEADRDLDDYLELVPLEPQWRSFFQDGSVLDLEGDLDRMVENVDEMAPGEGDGYRSFLELSERLHRISDGYFLWRSVESVRDTFEMGGTFQPSVLSDLLAMRMGRSVASTVRSHIQDERVAQMVDHFTQYVGSAPSNSPAVLCGIGDMQTSEGVWYPIGGTAAIPRALVRLATELGVEMRTGVDVARIRTENGRALGVETIAGEFLPAAAVVSNSDAARTYRELLGGEGAPSSIARDKVEPACSGVVLYLGLRERYEHLAHHDFVFSRDAEEEFDAIYRRGEPAPDPTCYLCAPAATDPAVAPPGGEALYVLVHAPYLREHHDWSRMLPEYRRVILDKLKRTAGLTDLEDRIVYEAALTPQDIHDRYRVLNGAIYGLASHGLWNGAFKPGNRSRGVDGLYLAGGAAHPGPGMPMVLMSGWIAADSLDQDEAAETARHPDLARTA
jgi:phytoene desaturase